MEAGAQTPGPLVGTLALESGTTVTQAGRSGPPAPAVTGTAEPEQRLAWGCPSGLLQLEASSRRP